MPETSMDWWVIASVLVAVIGVYYARRQLKGSGPKTTNEIKGGNRNTQQGGSGPTVNRIEDGDDNEQKG